MKERTNRTSSRETSRANLTSVISTTVVVSSSPSSPSRSLGQCAQTTSDVERMTREEVAEYRAGMVADVVDADRRHGRQKRSVSVTAGVSSMSMSPTAAHPSLSHHDHQLHNLQLHHHHHGGGAHLSGEHLRPDDASTPAVNADGGVSDESGDEESDERTAADMHAVSSSSDGGSDNDNDHDNVVIHSDDNDAHNVGNDDDDSDVVVDEDPEQDVGVDVVDDSDGHRIRPLRSRRNTYSSRSASSYSEKSHKRAAPAPVQHSLLPLPAPVPNAASASVHSAGQPYGGPMMCYGTTPLQLMGPRFVDIPPWLHNEDPRVLAERKDDITHLHDEIISFCKWVSPTAEEKQMREDVISRISKVVETLWPSVQLRVFGSCATDIYLPTSDIDLCIMGANSCSSSPIDELASALRRRAMGRVQAIATARVPIIKLVDAATGCLVDISFDVPTGPAHINLIKRYLEEEPAVKPLALLLKYYLKQFGMNEPYTGGLGSYALIIMIISYLQLHKPKDPVKQQDLGVLLVGFLKLYGIEFNYFRTGLSIRDGGYYFPKSQRNWVDWQQPWLLSAEDPCFPENDISRMSYAVMDVRGCLANAYRVLVSKEAAYSAPSLLCRILLRDEKMMQQRELVRTSYSSASDVAPSAPPSSLLERSAPAPTPTGPPTVAIVAGPLPDASSGSRQLNSKGSIGWQADKKASGSRTVSAPKQSNSSMNSGTERRTPLHGSKSQQSIEAGPWASLVMRNDSSGSSANSRARGGKMPSGHTNKSQSNGTPDSGDAKEDLNGTWRRQPPSASSSRTSTATASKPASASSAKRSGGSGRWERSTVTVNGDRQRRNGTSGSTGTSSSSSSSSSNQSTSRPRNNVRQHNNSKRSSDDSVSTTTSGARPRRSSMRRTQTSPMDSSLPLAAVVAPSLSTSEGAVPLEPRKRRASGMDSTILDSIVVVPSPAGASALILGGMGVENEGADNGQHRSKTRNQKQKR